MWLACVKTQQRWFCRFSIEALLFLGPFQSRSTEALFEVAEGKKEGVKIHSLALSVPRLMPLRRGAIIHLPRKIVNITLFTFAILKQPKPCWQMLGSSWSIRQVECIQLVKWKVVWLKLV